MTPVEFATPPSDINEFVDAYHDGQEVRFRTLEDLIGDTAAPGLARWVQGN